MYLSLETRIRRQTWSQLGVSLLQSLPETRRIALQGPTRTALLF